MKTFCRKKSFVHVSNARPFKTIDKKYNFDDTDRRFLFSGDLLETITNQDYDNDITEEREIFSVRKKNDIRNEFENNKKGNLR